MLQEIIKLAVAFMVKIQEKKDEYKKANLGLFLACSLR